MAAAGAADAPQPPDNGAGVVAGGLANQPDADAAGGVAALALVAIGAQEEAAVPPGGESPIAAAVQPPDLAVGDVAGGLADQPGAGGAGGPDAGQGANPSAWLEEDPYGSADEGVSVCTAIARAASECGCLAAITDALDAMCEVAGNVQTFTAALLGNHMIILDGHQVTVLRLAVGLERVQAASIFADKLYASAKPPRSNKDGLVASLLAVLDVLYPEPATRPPQATAARAGGAQPAVTERDGSPDTGLIAKMCAVMDYREDRKTTSKECSADDMRELGRLIAPFVGSSSKGSADLCSMSQMRTILNEIGKHGRFPSEQSCQPDKMVRHGGDSSLAAPKAEKGKELVAEETTCARVLRGRFRTFCLAVGAGLLKQRDTPTDNMQDAAAAALSMHDALADAEHLVTHKQVEAAIGNCLQAARAAQNGDDRRRRGFTVACDRGAHAILEANTFARTFQAMGMQPPTDEAASTVPPAAGDEKPVTVKQLKELKQAIAGFKDKQGKRSGKPAGGKTHIKVKLADGTEKLFERLPGGNKDCPVHCTKAHAKDKWCHLNHSKK